MNSKRHLNHVLPLRKPQVKQIETIDIQVKYLTVTLEFLDFIFDFILLKSNYKLNSTIWLDAV